MFGRKKKLIERLNEGLALCAARSASDKEALQWERENKAKSISIEFNTERNREMVDLRKQVEQKNQLVMDSQQVSHELNARNTDLRTEIKHLNTKLDTAYHGNRRMAARLDSAVPGERYFPPHDISLKVQLEEEKKTVKYKNVEISRLNVQVCLLKGDVRRDLDAATTIREKNADISRLADKVRLLEAQVKHPAYIVTPRDGEMVSIMRENRDHWYEMARTRALRIEDARKIFKRILEFDIVPGSEGVAALDVFGEIKKLAQDGADFMFVKGDKDVRVKLED